MVECFSIVDLVIAGSSHGEGFLVKKGNDSLLAEQEFNYSFSFLLVEFRQVL